MLRLLAGVGIGLVFGFAGTASAYNVSDYKNIHYMRTSAAFLKMPPAAQTMYLFGAYDAVYLWWNDVHSTSPATADDLDATMVCLNKKMQNGAIAGAILTNLTTSGGLYDSMHAPAAEALLGACPPP